MSATTKTRKPRRNYAVGWVADCGCPVEGNAYWCDTHIKPLVWTPVGINAAEIARRVSRLHVAAPAVDVVRTLRTVLRVKALPLAVRYGTVRGALAAHRTNIVTYITVMGHAPMPDERLISRGMMRELTQDEAMGEDPLLRKKPAKVTDAEIDALLARL